MPDTLTLDLFAEPIVQTPPSFPRHAASCAAQRTDGALQLHPEVMQPPPALDHHIYAFIAQAKCHGHTDACLSNFWVDGAGRSRYDEREVARFANEVICGIRSDRPTMTPERWQLAIRQARAFGRGGKS